MAMVLLFEFSISTSGIGVIEFSSEQAVMAVMPTATAIVCNKDLDNFIGKLFLNCEK